MGPKEIEEQLKIFQDKFDKQEKEIELVKKDFELKLSSSDKRAKENLELAQRREDELQKFKEESEKKEIETKRQKEESQEKQILEFTDKLVKLGKITPAQKPSLLIFMKSLNSENETLKFSDNLGKTISHSQLSFFEEFIGNLSVKSVDFAECRVPFSSRPVLPNEMNNNNEVEYFMDVRQEGVVKRLPVQDQDLSIKALEYQEEEMKKGRTISYGDALIHVQKVLSAI